MTTVAPTITDLPAVRMDAEVALRATLRAAGVERYQAVELLGPEGSEEGHDAIDTWTQARVRLTLVPAVGPDALAAAQLRLDELVCFDHAVVAPPIDLGPRPGGGAFVVERPPADSTLASRLRDAGRLPLVLALSFVDGVARGLAAAHRVGLSHGALHLDDIDLLPADDGYESVRVRGWCHAPLRGQTDAAAGIDADVRALGAILVALLDGASPAGFGIGGPTRPGAGADAPTIPGPLAIIAGRAMAEGAQAYASAVELRDALVDAILDGLPLFAWHEADRYVPALT